MYKNEHMTKVVLIAYREETHDCIALGVLVNDKEILFRWAIGNALDPAACQYVDKKEDCQDCDVKKLEIASSKTVGAWILGKWKREKEKYSS